MLLALLRPALAATTAAALLLAVGPATLARETVRLPTHIGGHAMPPPGSVIVNP